MGHHRIGAFLAALAVLACGARADEAADGLREAEKLARAGHWSAAVEALPPSDALRPTHAPLLARAAPALADDRPNEAARLFAAWRRLDPDAPRPRAAMEAFWTRHSALSVLRAEDVPFFPVDAETLDLPGAGQIATVTTLQPRPYLPLSAVVEPRTGRAYPDVTTVYVSHGGPMALRFVVHHDGAADAARARQVGRFLGALSILSDGLLGRVSRAAYPVRVWLRPDGAPGADQWSGAITVRGVRTDRSALEWARQLAHEWGHATLPGVQGFTAPEAWANGDLGERLYLSRMDATGWMRAWEPGLDAAPYLRRYADPLRAAFAETGPRADLVRHTGREGYDHFLGAALYIEAAYGAPALVAALDDMDGQRTADFLEAFRRTLAGRSSWTMARLPRAVGPAPACFPAAGLYMLEAHGEEAETPPRTRRFDAGWTMWDWNGALTVRRAPEASAAPGAGGSVRATPKARE